MGDFYFWLNFYAIGVVVAALILIYDIYKMVKDEWAIHSNYFLDVALISLLSWLAVTFRFTVWLWDFVDYWYVWIVFKYKVWRNKKNK